MKFKLIFSFILLIQLIFTSCTKERVSRIDEYRKALLSNDANQICEASYYLGEAKDTASVPLLLNHLCDPRISHLLRFKGMSVYYCKTGALNKISGLNVQVKQHSMPDSNVIKQFYHWAVEKKIISKKE